MPMVLRSRKSIRAPTEDSDSEPGEGSGSSRLQGTGTRLQHEEGHDSDSESGQNLDLDIRESSAKEDSSQEMADMDIKTCSVLLNRFDSARSDPADRDEMNRRSGIPKSASRIPTFHKKTTTTTETTRAKTPEIKERSLLTPTVRFTSSELYSAEATTGFSSQVTAPRSLSEAFVTASPRPAIRAERESKQALPDQTRTGSDQEDAVGDAVGKEEGDTAGQTGGDNVGQVEGDTVGNQSTTEEWAERQRDAEEERTEKEEEEGITEEPAPWDSPTAAKEDVGSWTDPDSEEELPAVQSEAENIQAIEPELRPSESEAEAAAAPSETQEMPVQTTQDQKERWSFCSLLLRGLFPLILLLCGGFSLHLWLYGLPRSVEQLGDQLHLHWIHGIIPETAPCSSDCRASLVESIPVGLYPSAPALGESIALSWLRLLDRAEQSADIAAFYVTLRSSDQEPTDTQGRLVFEKLKSLKSKGVNLRLAVNASQGSSVDSLELAAAGAEIKDVDLKALTGGIVHTKLLVVDQRHLFVGSANMDWRSLSQVKEVGVIVEDCSCLSQDMARVFEVYWTIGGADSSLPRFWPARLSALSSSQNPLQLKFNGVPARVYLSSSPPQLSTWGRTDDLEAILSVIEDAQKFIHISVMDYIPQTLYTDPPRFWPVLDSALRAAACTRRLQVRLLISCWPQSRLDMFVYLQSLLVLNRPPLNCDIQVKVFMVPSTPHQQKIPFARVNHAKFMVTDRVVYIGTSNWSEDYFTQTAGVGLVVNQTESEPGPGLETLRSQTNQLFLRDWTSQYSTDLTVDQTDSCPLARTKPGLNRD